MWWFKEVPGEILFIMRKAIKKIFLYFSIDLLAKTLFLPWKRDEIDTSNLSLDLKLRVWIMNIVSRLVGATVRIITIVSGLFAIGITAVIGVFMTIGFVALPFLSIYLLIRTFV